VLHAGINADDINELKSRRSPIVLASEENVDLANQIPHVVVNFHRAGEIAGQHLLALGHRRFGAIVGCGLEGMQLGRLAGFKSALEAQGLRLDDASVRNVDDSMAGGHDAALSLLKADPRITALFTTNDLMAYGASQALAENGIRVPQDISLISITDIRLAQDMRPALTTVALRIEALATLSIDLLLDLIEKPDHQPRIVRVPDPWLVERSSTARARTSGPLAVKPAARKARPIKRRAVAAPGGTPGPAAG